MAIIDVVKWESNNKEFCHKFSSQNLRFGTQLVVNTSQTAFFVKGGQICDEFSSGTYTIRTDNIPILHKIISIPFGGNTPFQAEIWFINHITKLDMKWGTPTPIQLEDPKYAIIVPVRAFGQYGIKIKDSRVFLETLIGNMSTFSADTIDQYFRGKLISFLSSTISRKISQDRISILDINNYLMDVSAYCETEINKCFTRYGITLADFSIMSINVPQDDPSFMKLKDAKAKYAELSIKGRDFYQMERSFDVLDKAASNTSGATSPLMGIGVGMGVGNVMNGLAAQTINTNPAPIAPPPIPQEATWFVYVNGQQIGGQTYAQLSALMAQGTINENTLVWKNGMTNWATISAVPELAGIFSQTPPPIPPEPPQI